MATKENTTETSMDDIWKNFTTGDAPLSGEQVDTLEKAMQEAESNHGICRRVAVASLGRSGAELVDAANKDREVAVAFAETASCIRSEVERLKSIIEMMESAIFRSELALFEREDMEEIMSEVKAA